MQYTTSSTTKKPTVGDLIKTAEVYTRIGIDKKQCCMPYMSGDGIIISDPHSVGHYVVARLQPALENLATAIVIEQTAPFLESHLSAAKNRVTHVLIEAISLSRSSEDKEAADGFKAKLNGKNIEEAAGEIEKIVYDISTVMSNKCRIIAHDYAAHQRSGR